MLIELLLMTTLHSEVATQVERIADHLDHQNTLRYIKRYTPRYVPEPRQPSKSLDEWFCEARSPLCGWAPGLK
jgi:hypothetical protein